MGDFCIVDIEDGTGTGGDEVTFTLTETKTVKILAETNLTCDGWPGNNNNGENAYGDPYVYLYDSNGNLVEKDDDDGCTCGNNCPDSGQLLGQPHHPRADRRDVHRQGPCVFLGNGRLVQVDD